MQLTTQFALSITSAVVQVLPYVFYPKLGRSYPENLVHGAQSTAYAASAGGPHSVGDCEDSASKVAVTVRGSREKAQRMVDAAIQVIIWALLCSPLHPAWPNISPKKCYPTQFILIL